MEFAFLLVAELLLLHRLGRVLFSHIVTKLERLIKSRSKSMYILAIIFLPGTFIHELSHWLFAKILFVPAGDISIMPKVEDGTHIRLGSVPIGKSDIVRRVIIGMAPILVGNTIIFLLIHYLRVNNLIHNIPFGLITFWAVFEIGNTMFSSQKDWEGAITLFLLLFLAIIILFLLGVPLGTLIFTESVILLIKRVCLTLVFPIVIDLALVITLKFL